MSELLNGSAIEAVTNLTRAGETVQATEINGHAYYDSKHHVLTRIEDMQPKAITLSTLSGFVSVIKQERKRYNIPLFVYPSDVLTVAASTTLLDDLDRDRPYTAIADIPTFPYERYLSIEEMLIALRSKFLPSDDVDYLCGLLSSVTNSDSVKLKDDGMTQRVEVSQGVQLKQMADTKPIVRLAPYRTFIEVEQPESEFLFRVKSQGNEVLAALFEADGGAWKNNAMNNIKEYLEKALKDAAYVTVIA